MGRPINNLRKASIRTKINKAGYKKLIALGESVGAALLANIVTFATPTPALTVLTTDVTAAKTATAFMGQKRNRGSKVELAAAQAAATNLRATLTALLKYVENTAVLAEPSDIPAQTVILSMSGFGFAVTRAITPKSQIPTFVRQTNNHKFPGNVHRVNWKRPIGLIKGKRPSSYDILIGGVIVQTVTKCNAIIPIAPGVNVDIVIVPKNSRGTGNSFNATVKGLS